MAKKIVNIPDTKPPMQIVGTNNTLNIITDIQNINIKGKNYNCRLVSVSKDLEILPKWVNGIEYFNWIYKFKISECNFKYISFHLGYNDEVLKTDITKQ